MTMIEAEASGVPVFFCDPDTKEVAPKGSYIMSASPSPDDMAHAINELISHPEKIQGMSAVMLAHRNEALISNRIDILEKIFCDILNRSQKVE